MITTAMQHRVKPTKEELRAAYERIVPDVIEPNLRVLFCGINPSLYSAATGHHFARPGNRFWPALHLAGFTAKRLAPIENRELLKCGLGITNVVERATATAAELTSAEFTEGGRQLEAKVRRFKPQCLAVLGIGAYRTAFAQPQATMGWQRKQKIGETTAVWVLPNPSGLNAHYQLSDLADLFRELRCWLEKLAG